MSVTVAELTKIMDDLAPPALAEEWDNIGLQLGDPAQTVTKVLVSLDVEERVVDEAIHQKADLIISHHPLIFHPIKHLSYDQPIGRAVRKLIKHDIAVFSAHTNLDIVPGGVNDLLAELLGLAEVEVLRQTEEEKLLKFVVFVPAEYLDRVRNALCAAGAGHIGQYAHCTFAAAGEGTFLPLEGTNPFIGEQGKMEKVPEYRLETIIPPNKLPAVLLAVVQSHPYEEPAYDIYPTSLPGTRYGLGRVGRLPQPLTLRQLTGKVKEMLGMEAVRVAGDWNQVISKVAVCGGGGMSFLDAAKSRGAQCFITGDVKYHEGQNALAQGISVIDGGHYETEAIFIPRLVTSLNQLLAVKGVDILASQVNTNPWRFY